MRKFNDSFLALYAVTKPRELPEELIEHLLVVLLHECWQISHKDIIILHGWEDA